MFVLWTFMSMCLDTLTSIVASIHDSLNGKVPSNLACHYDESSECAHVSISEVACYRTERTLMGCADPLRRGIGAPHQCSRVNEQRSDWGESSLALFIRTNGMCGRYIIWIMAW